MRVHFQHISHVTIFLATILLFGCGTSRTVETATTKNSTTTKKKPIIKDQPQSAPLPQQH